MRKIIFTLFMLLSMCSFAQEPYKVYCELVGINKLCSNKINVTIDFGQEVKFMSNSSKQILVNYNGKKIEFNSMIDAMNYLSKRGWYFVQAYEVIAEDNHIYHWLLSKSIKNDDELLSGLMTKEQYDKSINK